jgi:hypothetical protein
MTRKVPDVVLERYRLKELPENSARAVEAMLAADPELQARLDALEISDDEIHRQYRNRITLHDVAAPSRRTVLRVAATALVVATAAIVLLVVLPRTLSPTGDLPTERAKGTVGTRPALSIYRRTAAGSERLADGDLVHAGDLLRVGYASGGRPFGLILSIDGRGAVTMHLPAAGERAVPLQPGSNILLDAAYELDDAPRIERFYFVTGNDAFAAGPVMQAARRAAAGRGGALPSTLSLPAGLDQVTFAIQKEERK